MATELREHMHDHIKDYADGAALATAIGAVTGIIPHLAALASLVWTCIRIYDWIKEKRAKGSD